MSLRLKTPLSALVIGALALSACRDVNRQPPKETLAIAGDVAGGTIPLPNDLALQAAPSQAAGVTREVLFSFVNAGSWPGDQTISIPVRSLVRNPETGVYEPSATPPAGIDAATVNASTVAIVRVSDSPDPTVLEPEFLGYGPRAGSPGFNEIRLRPKGGMPPGRYVVALRGGSQGVKTSDGEPLGADQPIMLIASNMDLTNKENWPPGFADKVALDPTLIPTLERLRSLYRLKLDWFAPPGDAATREAICRQALSIPAEKPLPEQTCWIPTINQQGQIVETATITPAYTAVDKVFPHYQLASLQAFEVAAPAPIVDSATSTVPFPSDFLRLTSPLIAHPASGGDVVQGCEAVRLPGDTRPCMRSIAALGPAAPGIASLDGASTTSLMIAPLSGPVQASTITSANVLVFELTAGGPRQMKDVAAALQGGGAAEYLTQPPGLVQTVSGTGVSTIIGLQPAVPVPVPGGPVVNLPPLKPKTTYIVMVTDGVKDLSNTPLARGTLGTLLFTVQSPIHDGTHSTVPSLTDAEALAIQTLRNALRPLAQGIEQQTGKKVVLGYTITTQDVKKTSADLTALPYNIEAGGAAGFFSTSDVADFDTTKVGITPAEFPQAFPNLQKFVAGNLATLDAMSGQTGTLDPLLPTWGAEQFGANRQQIPLLVAVPKAANVANACPAPNDALKCAPLVVFHHGLNGSHYQMVAAADALAAKGFIVAAIDAPFHGDRAYCAVDSDCQGGTCQLQPTNQKAPGVCTSGQLAFDPDSLSTVASGNYFISENFFRIRDAIRQDLLDHSALVLAAARPTGTPDALKQALGASGVAVNPTQVYFAGISLGGMIGTSLVPTNPRISRVALNVPGGTLVDVFTNAPAFRTDVEALLAKIIPGFTFDKVDSSNPAFDPAIAQSYAQTLIIAKWALDPAEPINYAADLTTKEAANAGLRAALGPLAVSAADAYGQMVVGDTVVPNGFNALLFENAGIDFAIYGTTVIPADSRHGLLLSQTPQGATERDDLANFLADLTVRAGQIALDPQ